MRLDGAAVLRGVLSSGWIERDAEAIDQILVRQKDGDMNVPGEGRFSTGLHLAANAGHKGRSPQLVKAIGMGEQMRDQPFHGTVFPQVWPRVAA